MATFVLVHGTFTHSAHWPALEKGLVESANGAGETARFERLKWTGRNRATAREIAAASIFNAVQKIWTESPTEKIFLIGHSHGGSAIAYFLKNNRKLSKPLGGCAFLSTPFIAIRRRTRARELLLLTLFFPYMALLIFWGQIAVPKRHTWNIIETAQYTPWYYWVGMISVLVVTGVILTRRERLLKSIERNIEQTLVQQTADIPNGNYLFLRCSGDEAAAALSAVQFIAWLGIRTSNFLKILLRPLFSSRKLIICLYLVLVGGLVGATLPFAVSFFATEGIAPITGLFYVRSVSDLLLLLLFIAVFLAGPFLFLTALFLAFVILTTQAFTLWAFGWARWSVGFFVELAVEPLPFGEHNLLHVNWSSHSTAPDGIVHSWTYAHPVAIQHLQEWVATSLFKIRTEPSVHSKS